jgi:hypothetical protein
MMIDKRGQTPSVSFIGVAPVQTSRRARQREDAKTTYSVDIRAPAHAMIEASTEVGTEQFDRS